MNSRFTVAFALFMICPLAWGKGITISGGYSVSELQVRIQGFSEQVFENAGFNSTNWYAMVLSADPVSNIELDPYIPLRDAVTTVFGVNEVFVIGGTGNGKTFAVIVSPNDIQNDIVASVSALLSQEVFAIGSVKKEFVTTGTFDPSSPKVRSSRCITRGLKLSVHPGVDAETPDVSTILKC